MALETVHGIVGGQMTLSEFNILWRADFYRHTGQRSVGALMKHLLCSDADECYSDGVKYTFYLRLSAYLRAAHPRWAMLIPYIICRRILTHYKYKFNISISHHTSIGSGLYLGHVMNIVVSDYAKIGKNCNVSHGVTIGQVNRGARKGTPTIGDNVYIGPGATIIGQIQIGNNVAIGANTVVTKDIPDNAVVVGVPSRVVSMDGSTGYVMNTDYGTN